MNYLKGVISGAEHGIGAASLRTAASAAEPFYAAATTVRNRLFDAGLRKSHPLGRPTISVGNLTTGGTGKTPMVCWLAQQLRAHGRQVAILARGYKSGGASHGDEQRMLDAALNGDASSKIALIANPDRVAGAAEALAQNPTIDVFLLDDAFQHRRAQRDLDVVLLSVPQAFGFEHLLPRGLLRESPAGLKRADAIVLTHCDQVSDEVLQAIETRVHRYRPNAPIYHAVHAHQSITTTGVANRQPMDWLAQTPFYAFAGIGAPEHLDFQLRRWGTSYRGHRWFPDHHHYQPADLVSLQGSAEQSGAKILLTTEKDWVKISAVAAIAQTHPIWRIEMGLRFLGEDESRFWEQIANAISIK